MSVPQAPRSPAWDAGGTRNWSRALQDYRSGKVSDPWLSESYNPEGRARSGQSPYEITERGSGGAMSHYGRSSGWGSSGRSGGRGSGRIRGQQLYPTGIQASGIMTQELRPGLAGTFDGGGGGSFYAGGGPLENKAENDPDLDYTLAELKKRYEGDGGAARAIDLAGGKIREAALGEGKALAAGQTARGVSGTGASEVQFGNLANRTLQKIAGASSEIALGREQARDALLSQIASTAATRSGTNLAQRELALRQWETAESNRRAAEQAKLARQMAVLEMLQRQAA